MLYGIQLKFLVGNKVVYFPCAIDCHSPPGSGFSLMQTQE